MASTVTARRPHEPRKTLFKEIRHNPLLWLRAFVPVVFIAAKVRPDEWYAAARVFAHAAATREQEAVADGYAGRAVELLRTAYEKGYKGRPDVRSDGLLNPLRGRDDFKKLLAELQARK